jgi:hypothetical protein
MSLINALFTWKSVSLSVCHLALDAAGCCKWPIYIQRELERAREKIKQEKKRPVLSVSRPVIHQAYLILFFLFFLLFTFKVNLYIVYISLSFKYVQFTSYIGCISWLMALDHPLEHLWLTIWHWLYSAAAYSVCVYSSLYTRRTPSCPFAHIAEYI